MRRAARTDENHAFIRDTLRKAGASVADTSRLGQGFPDLVAGIRGINYLIEIKDGNKIPSQRKLTADEAKWHDGWRGQVCVIENVEDALRLIGLTALGNTSS